MVQGSTDHTRGQLIGSQIAGVFGTVFVSINSAGLPAAVRTVLIVVAGAALIAIIVLSVRVYRRGPGPDPKPGPGEETRRSPFGWKYWVVVAIEAVALFGGTRILGGLGHPELGVAWVAVVVGTHFFALARIFGLARFHLLGALITACGLAGFVLRLVGEVAPIAVISGVVSGFVLLAFGLWAFAPVRRR